MNLEMASIESIRAREILDSRGNPTIEAEVTLVDGTVGIASFLHWLQRELMLCPRCHRLMLPLPL